MRNAALANPAIRAVWVRALFTSPLQPSDEPGADAIVDAVHVTLVRHGARGCVATVAGEYGDHPDTAAPRMRWCRACVAAIAEPATAETADADA